MREPIGRFPETETLDPRPQSLIPSPFACLKLQSIVHTQWVFFDLCYPQPVTFDHFLLDLACCASRLGPRLLGCFKQLLGCLRSNDVLSWQENIIGRAVFKYWPIWEVGTIPY